MGIGNGIIKWWLQNFYATKFIKYEPGFIVTEFDNKYGKAFQRLVTLPESICIEIENQVCAKYKESGVETLKTIGKLSGYNFGITLNAPRLSTNGEISVKDYSSFLISYGMSSWAKETNIIKYDIINNEYSIQYDNHIVCSKNGNGILFTEYQLLGFLEYMLERSLILKSSKCQGRNDNYCIIEYCRGSGVTINPIYNSSNLKQYYTMNSIRDAKYSTNSWDFFLRNKLATVKEGRFIIKDESVINVQSLLLFLLEKEISKLPEGSDMLFDIGFQWGEKFSYKQNINFVADILSAFGYGDILIKRENGKYQIILINYPWEPLEPEINDFYLIRGICSGLLSKINNQKIILKQCKKIIDYNGFTLILS